MTVPHRDNFIELILQQRQILFRLPVFQVEEVAFLGSYFHDENTTHFLQLYAIHLHAMAFLHHVSHKVEFLMFATFYFCVLGCSKTSNYVHSISRLLIFVPTPSREIREK
jgi:hypothetical protein